jgi:hypothetical protein
VGTRAPPSIFQETPSRPGYRREQRGDLCHSGGLHGEALAHLPAQFANPLAQFIDLLALLQLGLAQSIQNLVSYSSLVNRDSSSSFSTGAILLSTAGDHPDRQRGMGASGGSRRIVGS